MTEAQRLKVSLAQLWGAFEEDIEVEVLECLQSAEKLEHDEMQRQVSPLLAPRVSRFAFPVSGGGSRAAACSTNAMVKGFSRVEGSDIGFRIWR